jgi:hypothetical protein
MINYIFNKMRKSNKVISIILIAGIVFSCSPPGFTRHTSSPKNNPVALRHMDDTDVNQENIFKLHMKDATVYIMKNWKVSENDSTIVGFGALFDANRNLIKKDEFKIPIKDIALVETNDINPNPSIIALALVTGASLALTVYCILNPKSCFGSCPTFYAWNGTEMQLQAEGFSGSVAPTLEDKDIDALYFAKAENGNLTLKMTNEALETHVVRYADILAIPKTEKSRVFATSNGTFYQADEIYSPSGASGQEGDILDKITKFDSKERFSNADSNDLSEKEILEINFKDLPAGNKALVLAYRQTLMTTYLYYSALSYMGNSAGDYLAMLERENQSAHGSDFMKNVYNSKEILGGIKVYIQNDKTWEYVGEYFELGPISTDIQLLLLNKNIQGDCKVRLELTKGLWRVDYVALINNYEEVHPIRLQPSYVIKKSIENKENNFDKKALQELTDNTKTLITLPGDEYIFNYKLPDESTSYEFFLESKGYYIEWMRKEWLKDENPVLLSKLILNPNQYLKDIAPEFKKLEPGMEEAFWRSRYVKK